MLQVTNNSMLIFSCLKNCVCRIWTVALFWKAEDCCAWKCGNVYSFDVEQTYRSAVSEISETRRKKALLNAHSQLSKVTVMRIEEFTKRIQHKHEQLSELRRYECSASRIVFILVFRVIAAGVNVTGT